MSRESVCVGRRLWTDFGIAKAGGGGGGGIEPAPGMALGCVCAAMARLEGVQECARVGGGVSGVVFK